MKIAIDTGVIITAVSQGGTYGAEGKIMQLIHQGEFKATTSCLTVAELLSNHNLNDQQADDFYQTLQQFNVTYISLDAEIMATAAKLSRKHSLTIGDSIQLASALQSADCFITNDKRLTELQFKKFSILSADQFFNNHS